MVGAEGGNSNVLASHLDLHILGVCHTPLVSVTRLSRNSVDFGKS